MFNNINAQKIDNSNIIAAKKLGTKADTNRSIGVIQAPDYLPKYSITQKMEEADQFRKNVINSNYIAKQRKNNRKKILTVLSATLLGLFALKKSKKI